ncbi:PilN domain-containing protein [Sporomusa sp.]|uniref:PilN domain-containing protein n=1 Tax=Sporomusa sp. TaxID=2078658 RepID=UPI002B950195|nr:PilN domain-containing protein [Sporomusa sp.]HWR43644.1 PilN domain-containing protein [Sporomusa sp.]
MITINLLPPSERRSEWPFKKIVLLFIIVFIMLFSSMFAYNTYIIWSLEQQIESARQQYVLLRPTQDKMQLANTKQNILDEKKNTLIKLTTDRKSWNAILSHFGVITPPQVWLSELGAGDKNIILIKGNAMTYPDLANFITQLEQDALLVEPVLIKAEQDAKYSYTKFEMTVKLKGI